MNAQGAAEGARRSVPWFSRDNWWMLALEGVGLLVLGFSHDAIFSSAGDAGRFLSGIVVLGIGSERVAASRRLGDAADGHVEVARVGAAVLAALPALLSPWLTAISPERAWQFLASGLLAYGSLGLVAVGMSTRAGDVAQTLWRTLLPDLLWIVVGVLLLAVVHPEAIAADLDWGTGLVGVGIVRLWEALNRWWKTRRAP